MATILTISPVYGKRSADAMGSAEKKRKVVIKSEEGEEYIVKCEEDLSSEDEVGDYVCRACGKVYAHEGNLIMHAVSCQAHFSPKHITTGAQYPSKLRNMLILPDTQSMDTALATVAKDDALDTVTKDNALDIDRKDTQSDTSSSASFGTQTMDIKPIKAELKIHIASVSSLAALPQNFSPESTVASKQEYPVINISPEKDAEVPVPTPAAPASAPATASPAYPLGYPNPMFGYGYGWGYPYMNPYMMAAYNMSAMAARSAFASVPSSPEQASSETTRSVLQPSHQANVQRSPPRQKASSKQITAIDLSTSSAVPSGKQDTAIDLSTSPPSVPSPVTSPPIASPPTSSEVIIRADGSIGYAASESTPAISFPCTECSRIFQMSGSLRRHMGKHHPSKAIPCTQCKAKCFSPEELTRHMSVYHKHQVQCPHCIVKLPSQDQLNWHMKQWHQKNFTDIKACPYCTKQFLSATLLEAHVVEDHAAGQITPKQPQSSSHRKCTNCPRSFNHVEYLIEHQAVSHNHCACCPKTFDTRGEVLRHLESIHQIRRHPCPICKTVILGQAALEKHIKDHNNSSSADENTYACTMCSYTHSDKAAIKAHMARGVHTVPEIHCSLCKVSFSSKSALNSHFKGKQHSKKLLQLHKKMVKE